MERLDRREKKGSNIMKKKTVKQRIFQTNAWMILTTIIAFLVINLGIAKIYIELIEHKWDEAMKDLLTEDQMKELLTQWTVQQHSFRLLVIVDLLLCILALILVSYFFTGRLAWRIMEPLEMLSQGADRIREGTLSQSINYQGDEEFENTCNTFNDMQNHILIEQEKNEKYEKARTDMVAGISHDLRTPLTAIRGTIKGLIDGVAKTPEQQQAFLKIAYKRTQDMDVLINQLFYLSKLETGNMPLQIQKVDIVAFLRSYVQGKQNSPEARDIELQINTDIERAEVLVDMEQMQRILDNLFENSKKYAEVEELRLTLQISRTLEQICIEFSDNGNGVEELMLPHLFEEFYRGDESRGRKEGNGLGLYIVKCLIEAMGGSVTAKNRDGLVIEMQLPVREEK